MHDAHSIRKICNFFKKRKCARKVFIVFVTLSDFNKTSNRAATRASEPDPGAKEQSIFLGAGATFKIQAKQELEPEPDVYRTAPAPKLFLRCYFY